MRMISNHPLFTEAGTPTGLRAEHIWIGSPYLTLNKDVKLVASSVN